MLAKLTVLKEPGFVMKRIEQVRSHGEVEFYSLAENAGDQNRLAYIVVNDVLFGIAPVWKLESLISGGQIASTYEPLVELLRDQQRNERDFTVHRLRWEALQLPSQEWDERIAQLQREREEAKARHGVEDAEKKARTEEHERRLWEESVAKVLAGEAVSGTYLLFMARQLGIEVHLRTAGALKKTIWISEHQSYGPKSESGLRYDVYSRVKKVLETQTT